MTAQSAAQPSGLQIEHGGDTTIVQASGDWTIDQSNDCEKLLKGVAEGCRRSATIDLGGLTRLDTAGAWLIHRLRAEFELHGARVTFRGVPETYALLFEEIESHNPPPWSPPVKSNPALIFFERVGKAAVSIYEDIVSVLHILGAFGVGLTMCLTRLSRMRGNAILNQFSQTCIGAVPIVILMSFLIGGIIAQQGAFYLRQFGAEIYAVDLAGLLMAREIGVLLTAIMVAGRSGSAFTAELGSMKMREEIDALRVLGLDHIEVLILPRVIALILTMPILTFVSIMSGWTGAGLMLWAYSGIQPAAYIDLLHITLMWDPHAIIIGFAKAPFMALIIALIACVEGLKVEGSAESLGRHTTMSVVKAIFMVIVVDGLFAVYFVSIGF
ncbi:MAG: ABC transporter permease [Pseudomonadota bacterium]